MQSVLLFSIWISISLIIISSISSAFPNTWFFLPTIYIYIYTHTHTHTLTYNPIRLTHDFIYKYIQTHISLFISYLHTHQAERTDTDIHTHTQIRARACVYLLTKWMCNCFTNQAHFRYICRCVCVRAWYKHFPTGESTPVRDCYLACTSKCKTHMN